MLPSLSVVESVFLSAYASKPSAMKPLKFWSVTVGDNHHTLLDPPAFDAILDEFFHQWCYQGELGDKNKKKHYQCRLICAEPTMKATMLHCFKMRGIALQDVTVLPESNKSIEQGGLAFYVMDSTKDVWLPTRADASYSRPRPKDWIPSMCQCIQERPRPWMRTLTSILDGLADHRKIVWICTLFGLGGVGKSLFVAWLEATRKACYLGAGTPIQLQEAVISDGEWPAYTLDLPKQFAKDNSIGDYINVVEIIKNGFIKTGMHGKRKKLMMDKRPHVVLFCNRLPPWSMMTEGRFDVYTINPRKPEMFQTLDVWEGEQGSQD